MLSNEKYYKEVFKKLPGKDWRKVTFAYDKIDLDKDDIFWDNWASLVENKGIAIIDLWYPIGG